MNQVPSLSRWRQRPGLLAEIAAVLVLKLAVITALWFAFFGPDTRVEVSPASVSRGLLDRAPAATSTPPTPRSSE
ncbi:MAG: hypothetical protein RR101_04215 [Burkholderiaceae bacterium]